MFRRRRRSERQLTLSPLNRFLPLRRYRDVRFLDAWQPLDYPATPYPERAHVLYAVTQRVEQLCEEGSVDAELGHVVDDEIAHWLDQWLGQLPTDAADKRRVIRGLLGESTGVVSHRRDDNTAAQARLAEATEEYRIARALYFDRDEADVSSPVPVEDAA